MSGEGRRWSSEAGPGMPGARGPAGRVPGAVRDVGRADVRAAGQAVDPLSAREAPGPLLTPPSSPTRGRGVTPAACVALTPTAAEDGLPLPWDPRPARRRGKSRGRSEGRGPPPDDSPGAPPAELEDGAAAPGGERPWPRGLKGSLVLYLWAWGPTLVLGVAGATVLTQALRTGVDLWLAGWVVADDDPDTFALRRWVLGLAALASACALAALAGGQLFATGVLRGARTLHGNLLRALLEAPRAFLDASRAGEDPGGALASDFAAVDERLPESLGALGVGALDLAVSAAVLVWVEPLLLAGLPLVAVACLLVWRSYRSGSQEMRRLEASLQAPLLRLVHDVARGGPEIRALGLQASLMREARGVVAGAAAASGAHSVAGLWLAVRLHLVAWATVTTVAAVAVLRHSSYLPLAESAEREAAGLGLSLLYTLPLTGALHTVLASAAEVEAEAAFLGRVRDLLALCGAGDGDGDGAPGGGGGRTLEAQLRAALPRGPGWRVEEDLGEPLGAGARLTGLGLVAAGLRGAAAAAARPLARGAWPLRWAAGRARGAVGRLRARAGGGAGPGGSGRGPSPEPPRPGLPPPGQRERGWLARMVAAGPAPGGVARAASAAATSVRARLEGSVPSHPGRPVPHLSLEGVWLRYSPRAPWVLQDLTFDVARGEEVSILGRTGAGKTSIFHLLLRFHRPTRGAVRVSGEDVGAIPASDLRTYVGTVVQAPVILAGSLRDNLDPTGRFEDAELAEVLRAVQLWEPLLQSGRHGAGAAATGRLLGRGRGRGDGGAGRGGRAVPGGATTPRLGGGPQAPGARYPARHDAALPTRLYNLNPGEAPRSREEADAVREVLDGLAVDPFTLSFGQQQQLGLARVLLRRPRIVLMDESTSSMDPLTAAAVGVMCRRLLSGCTVLQVAHRLRPVMESNSVLLLQGGRVVESGSPRALMRDPASRFAKLVKISRDFNEGEVDY